MLTIYFGLTIGIAIAILSEKKVNLLAASFGIVGALVGWLAAIFLMPVQVETHNLEYALTTNGQGDYITLRKTVNFGTSYKVYVDQAGMPAQELLMPTDGTTLLTNTCENKLVVRVKTPLSRSYINLFSLASVENEFTLYTTEDFNADEAVIFQLNTD